MTSIQSKKEREGKEKNKSGPRQRESTHTCHLVGSTVSKRKTPWMVFFGCCEAPNVLHESNRAPHIPT